MFFDFPKIGASMQDALADPAAIPCLQILRGYWEGLRQDGALPHREAVSPSGLGGALENCFIVERIAPGMGRFRVAGSAVTDVLGLEPRGMPLTMLLEPVARGTLTRVLDEVFTAATALDITLEAERAIGRPHLAARMILLPIRGASGEYHQAIGALALSGQIGRAPRRFGITRMRSETIDAPAAFIQPALQPLNLTDELPHFTIRPSSENPRAHLRLVHSRD
jgi:hypothetical protein